MSKRWCVHGHDTWLWGRTSKGGCKRCARNYRDTYQQRQTQDRQAAFILQGGTLTSTGRLPRRWCKRGHDMWEVGVVESANRRCALCWKIEAPERRRKTAMYTKKRQVAKREHNMEEQLRNRGHAFTTLDSAIEARAKAIEAGFVPDSGGMFLSEALGDYYKVQEDRYGGDWHPYDPNRIVGWQASGSGWPEDEYTILLRHKIAHAQRASDHFKKMSVERRYRILTEGAKRLMRWVEEGYEEVGDVS